MYNGKMTFTDAITVDEKVKKIQEMLAAVPSPTIRSACRAVDLPERTYYDRISKEKSLSPDRQEAQSSTPASTGASDLSEDTIPGDTGLGAREEGKE